MAQRPSFEVDSWKGALALVRHVASDAEVTVSKRDEPLLPPGVPVRRSNVPWSVHKGARRVFREERPSEHVQIREYPDHWTVEVDSFNPHYRPLRHLMLDTGPYTIASVRHPIRTMTSLLLYAPARTLQVGLQLADPAVWPLWPDRHEKS